MSELKLAHNAKVDLEADIDECIAIGYNEHQYSLESKKPGQYLDGAHLLKPLLVQAMMKLAETSDCGICLSRGRNTGIAATLSSIKKQMKLEGGGS